MKSRILPLIVGLFSLVMTVSLLWRQPISKVDISVVLAIVLLLMPFLLGLLWYFLAKKAQKRAPLYAVIIVLAQVIFYIWIVSLFLVPCCGPPLGRDVDVAFAGLCNAMLASQCRADPAAIAVTGMYDLNQDGQPDSTTTLAQVCGLMGRPATTNETGANPCRMSCGCPE